MLTTIYAKQVEAGFKANKNKIRDSIIRYIDRYSNVLYSVDFSEYIYFSDDDKSVIYNNIGVTEDELDNSIKESKDINPAFKVSSNSFYHACMLVIREAMLKNDKDMPKLIGVYMSFLMYSSMHSNFLEHKPNKAIMDYTINNLDNNFKIKKSGSIFALLEDNAITWLNTYEARIKRGTDNDFVYIINALQTRIKGKLRKIMNEFYENHKSGKYLNMDNGAYTEENYREVDNNSYMSARLADKVYLRMIQKSISTKLLKYSITKSDTSFTKLKSIIEDIIKNDDKNELKNVIQSIIDYYVITSGNGVDKISSGEFISYMISAYASNSDSTQTKYIKDTIDEWLEESGSRFGMKRYGKTAMSSYKKAIYMYLVYTINLNSKI